jgi:hypothetical protein
VGTWGVGGRSPGTQNGTLSLRVAIVALSSRPRQTTVRQSSHAGWLEVGACAAPVLTLLRPQCSPCCGPSAVYVPRACCRSAAVVQLRSGARPVHVRVQRCWDARQLLQGGAGTAGGNGRERGSGGRKRRDGGQTKHSIRCPRLLQAGMLGDSAGLQTRNNSGWSGRRDSNPRPIAWEAIALPLRHSRECRRSIPNPMAPVKRLCGGCGGAHATGRVRSPAKYRNPPRVRYTGPGASDQRIRVQDVPMDPEAHSGCGEGRDAGGRNLAC